MKLTMTEKLVLDVIDGKKPFTVLHYKKKFGSTKQADKATASLVDKGIIELGEDKIYKRNRKKLEL